MYSDIKKVYFVWNADWSLRSLFQEIKNYIKGVHICSLCNIAYSGLTPKPEWKRLISDLNDEGIKSKIFYKNKLPKNLNDVSKNNFPIVIGEKSDGELVVILNNNQIDECVGDLGIFKDKLMKALEQNFILKKTNYFDK